MQNLQIFYIINIVYIYYFLVRIFQKLMCLSIEMHKKKEKSMRIYLGYLILNFFRKCTKTNVFTIMTMGLRTADIL